MNIILYSKLGCPWCDEVLALFREKGVAFEEKECRNNKQNFDELVAKSGQSLTPTLDIDGEIIADSDAAALTHYFHKKGVPCF